MTRAKEILLVSGTFIAVLLIGGGGWFTYTHPFYGSDSQPLTTASIGHTANTSARERSQPHRNNTVTVYFSKHPESDDDPNLTFPVHRTIESGDVQSSAVSALLTGPTAAESTRGYFSSVRLKTVGDGCQQKDFTLTVKAGRALLLLCRPFDHTGSLTNTQAVNSLKATMGQFENINDISVVDTSGNCVFTTPSPQLCTGK